MIQTAGTLIIKITISPNKKDVFICLIENNNYLTCLVYNSESNELTDKIGFFDGFHLNSPNTGVYK